MPDLTKGKSPFYPGQPVPLELFVGRQSQIDRIRQRGAGQVANGKPVAMFIEGEYGIGKRSIAMFTGRLADGDYGLHDIYATLGACDSVDDVARSVLEATIRSGAFHENRSAKIRNWLAKYIGDQSLFGLSLKMSSLREDAPALSSATSMLSFLQEVRQHLKDTGIKGICLILDEINGVAANPKFANFVKGLVDSNAALPEPVPLLLILCGVADRRREMIEKHQPVERIFDVIQIEAMSNSEMEEFFTKAFASVNMTVDSAAMSVLTRYSAGFPKIMHLIGDAAYWSDTDGRVSGEDALRAVITAAEEVGKKYVDQQVYNALRSRDYRAILDKIGELDPYPLSFKKSEVASKLTEKQKQKLDNFLQRMKRLNVISAGDGRGEYKFNVRMVRMYIWLQTLKSRG